MTEGLIKQSIADAIDEAIVGSESLMNQHEDDIRDWLRLTQEDIDNMRIQLDGMDEDSSCYTEGSIETTSTYVPPGSVVEPKKRKEIVTPLEGVTEWGGLLYSEPTKKLIREFNKKFEMWIDPDQITPPLWGGGKNVT